MRRGRSIRPPAAANLSIPTVADPDVSRALQVIGDQVATVVTAPQMTVRVVDLAIGRNRIPHGLGRPPLAVAITPAIVNAAWAWAWNKADNTAPHLEVWIETVGALQPGATLQLW